MEPGKRRGRAGAVATLAALAMAVVVLAGGVGASAQEPASGKDVAPVPGTVGVEQLEGLVATLEDPAARDTFVTQLKALIASAQATEAPKPEGIDSLGLSFAAQLGERTNAFARSIADLAAAIVNLPDLGRWVVEQAEDPDARSFWVEVLGKIAALLLLAAVAYRLVRRLTMRTRERLGEIENASPLERLRRLLARTAIDILPAVAFGGISFGVLHLFDLGPEAEQVALLLIQATVAIQIVLILTRALLTPRTPGLRFIPIGDESAAYLYVWIKRFSHVVLYSYFVFRENVLRIPPEVLEGLTHLVGFLITLMVVIFILQNREAVGSWLRGRQPDGGRMKSALVACRSFTAGTWHLLAIGYVAGTYLVWALKVPGGFELLFRGAVATTILLLLANPLAQWVERMIGRGFSVGEDLEHRYPALQVRVNRYITILHRFSVGIVYLLIALAILRIWQVDLIGWAGASLGTELGQQAVNLGLLLAVIFLIWEGSSTAVEHYLEAVDETGKRIERSGRVRTLLPLLQTALLVIMGVIFLLQLMSAMGLDLAPLLAAAGVIGIAIGFGSQKLVQDVINGLFILFQDTIAVGEFVEVAGHDGIVERMSVRTLELRDLSGVVHTIPFSEITTVKNWAKEFGYALLDIGVAYREDVDEVIEVLRQVGAELEADPSFGQFMLEPIDVWGLDSFGDSALIIRARLKTKPLKQWYLKREFNRRLKQRFDQLGIEIPFPHQTVYFGQDKTGQAAPMHVRVGPADAGATEVDSALSDHSGLRVVEQGKSPVRDQAKR